MTSEQKASKTATGTVISDKMDKSIVVLVERKVKHPKYGKYVTRSTRLYAHDEQNECKIGDLVMIGETKPYSKTKTWKLLEIVTGKTST